MDDSDVPFELILASFSPTEEQTLRDIPLEDLLQRLGSRAIKAKKDEIRRNMKR